MTTHEALSIFLAPHWYEPLICGIVCGVHAVQDGEVDARHFDRRESPHQVGWPDIHRGFVIRRSCLWILVIVAAGVPTAVGCVFIFPLLHNGNYYATRKLLDGNVYQQGWSSEPSTTSTAKWNFTYSTRCWFAAIGIVILATVILATLNHASFMR